MVAELFWFALGFITATFVFNRKFRDWVKAKIGRKDKGKEKETETKNENGKTIKVD